MPAKKNITIHITVLLSCHGTKNSNGTIKYINEYAWKVSAINIQNTNQNHFLFIALSTESKQNATATHCLIAANGNVNIKQINKNIDIKKSVEYLWINQIYIP